MAAKKGAAANLARIALNAGRSSDNANAETEAADIITFIADSGGQCRQGDGEYYGNQNPDAHAASSVSYSRTKWLATHTF